MDEPSFLLRAVTWHFGSGDALFTAWGLVLIATIVQARGGRFSRVAMIAVLGLVWMVLAAWPVTWEPYWFAALIVYWLVGSGFPQRYLLGDPRKWRVLQCLIVAILCGFELSWHVPIKPVAPDAASVAIIGDSVTAGLNAGDITWPWRLANRTGRTVYDASQQGATVKSALSQLEKLDGRGEVLWIEIGGNDILESLPSHVYAERLDQFLNAATKRYQKIILMEIPAPPFGGRYGFHQRQLASKYHLPLVPKRQFLSVLTSSGGTQDGVHLANAGHQRMATIVQTNLGWKSNGAGKDNGVYVRCE